MGLFGQTAKKAGGATKKGAPAKKATGVFKNTSSKRRDDDEDEDGDGARPSKAGGARKIGAARVTSGWGGAKKLRDETATWAPTLKVDAGDTIVIRFLDDEPYANVAMHWVERKGRKSFICIGKDCPLCARGDKPRTTYNFNVAQLTDGEPLAYTLEAKSRVMTQIEEAAKDAKYGPLSKKYYTFKRTGTKRDNTVYTLAVVKRTSDLSEDFPELNVPTEEELEDVKRYTKEDALSGWLPKHKLEEIAREEWDEPDDEED